MQRNFIFAVVLVGATGFSMASRAAEPEDRVERFEGVARSKAGAFVYKESHEVEYRGARPQRSVTRYFDGAGKKIAELVSDYRKDPYAPDYQFRDARGTTTEAAELTLDGIRLRYGSETKLLGRKEQGAKPMVLGQGLHQLVQARVEALAQGEKLVVRFAIPSRLDSYLFRIERLAASDARVVRLQIRIDNRLLSLIAPTLEVDYEPGTRRLLAYRGVSNLSGPDGKPMQVTIRYSYPAAASAAAMKPAAALAALQEKP